EVRNSSGLGRRAKISTGADLCELTAVGRLGLWIAGCELLIPELRRKVHQRFLMAIHFTEIEALAYLSNFVTKASEQHHLSAADLCLRYWCWKSARRFTSTQRNLTVYPSAS